MEGQVFSISSRVCNLVEKKLPVSILSLTCVVRQDPLLAIKGEPTFLPSLDPPAHLDQVTLARFAGHPHVLAGLNTMSRGLQMFAQVEGSWFRFLDLRVVVDL